MSAESEPSTVTPLSHTHLDGSMNAMGTVLAVLIAIVLLPLLPVAAVVWVVTKLVG